MKKQISTLIVALVCLTTVFATQKVENYNTKQPSVFYPNKGQIIDQDRKVRKDVRYHYAAPGFALSITDKGMSWTVSKAERFEKKASTPSSAMAEATPPKEGNLDSLVFHTHRVDVEFVGANMMIPIEEAQVQGYYQNFYTEYTGEQGVTNLHGAKQITLKNVWNGIDIVFQAKEEGKLEYDFVLHPNADIKDIQLKYNGGNGIDMLKTDNYPSLRHHTTFGDIVETIPMSYEKENSKAVTVGYQLTNNIVSFATKSEYNKQNTLVIDPQLIWGTYFGGSGDDFGSGIVVDGSGIVYITGRTQSTSGIATTGSHQTSHAGSIDVFVAKFNSSGVRQWGIYYGGGSADAGFGIAEDGSGNIYISGYAVSTSGITTSGTHQTSHAGGWDDAFIAKFNTSGARQWGTYYGGSSQDGRAVIAIDDSGNVYITGYTQSTFGIATSGAHQTSLAGTWDVFIAKFNSSGVQLWGSYYGGSNGDYGNGIALDGSGNVYIIGGTVSSSGIATSGAHQTSLAGSGDVFIAKFNSSGVQQWGSYCGGSNHDWGYGIALDSAGKLYITGETGSTSGIATSGVHQISYAGGFNNDAFIAKFNTTGVRQWGTYYGGRDDDYGEGIDIDGYGNVYITGRTYSTSGIVTSGAHQTSFAGSWDAFLTKFDTSGVQQWGTYYGGSDYDYGQGIVVDGYGNVNITGITTSNSGIATSGTHQTSYGGSYDAFIAKFSQPCTTPIANAGRDTALCLGQNIKIGAAALSGHYYKWSSNPAGFSDTTSSPNVNPNQTITYYLQDSVSGGCVGYDTVTITVNPLPSVQILKDTSVCYGSTINLGGLNLSGFSYAWSSNPTGFASNNANPSVQINLSRVYTLTVTNTLTQCSAKDSVEVKLYANPMVNIISDTAICYGEQIDIGGFNITNYDYSWSSNPNGFNSNTSNPRVRPLQSTRYILEVTDKTTSCQASDSVLVTVNPLPNPQLGMDKVVCTGDSVKIGVNGSVLSKYSWSNGVQLEAQFVRIANQFILTETILATGCSNSDTINVSVSPRPNVDLGNDTMVASGTLLMLGKPYQTGYSYKWNTGDTTAQKTFVANKDTLFSLVVINANGCSDTDEVRIKVLTGFEGQEIGTRYNLAPEVVVIYPNPADNAMLTIQGVNQSANLRITDMNGKTLYQLPLQALERQTVNTHLPQGMYLVAITLPNQVVMKKWMVR